MKTKRASGGVITILSYHSLWPNVTFRGAATHGDRPRSTTALCPAMARRIPGLRPFLPAEARMAPRKFTAVDFFELRTKNQQTFGYANKWLYFFCRVQTFTDCTSRPSATGTWPQDAPALVVCVASYTRFMDCFPCRVCVPAAVLEHTSAK